MDKKMTMRQLAIATDSEAYAKKAAENIVSDAPDVRKAAMRLSSYRKELKTIGKDQAFINAAKIPAVTIAARKEYSESQRIIEKKPIVVPKRLLPDAIRARVRGKPDNGPVTMQDVIDLITCLALRTIELRTMTINPANGMAYGYAKSRGENEGRLLISFAMDPTHAHKFLTWVQKAIRDCDIPDPNKDARIYKKIIEPLNVSDLRKIGSEHTARFFAGEKSTDGKRMQYRRMALRHSDQDTPSSAEYYSNVMY
jgi:hypothetical protein